MMRRGAALVGTLVAALTLMALPATADQHDSPEDAGSTDAEFTVTSDGALTISVPAPEGNHNLGTVEPNGTLDAQLGDVTVTDDRPDLSKTWSVYVEADDFIAPDSFTVPAGDLTYNVAEADIAGNLTDGIQTAEPTSLDGGVAVEFSTLDLSLGLVLSGDATWNPSITFEPAGEVPSGTYESTITHSLLP